MIAIGVEKQAALSHQELLQLVSYDPNTGLLTWRTHRRGAKTGPGDVCQSVDKDGYISASVRKRRYRAHRLIWFYVTGEWPDGEVDHIDGNRLNNKFSNLRVTDRKTNSRNRQFNRGYMRHGRGWKATICVDGKTLYLGVHATEAEARAAYVAAKLQHHGVVVQ